MPHSCVIIDGLADVWVEEFVKEFVEGFTINVYQAPEIFMVMKNVRHITFKFYDKLGSLGK